MTAKEIGERNGNRNNGGCRRRRRRASRGGQSRNTGRSRPIRTPSFISTPAGIWHDISATMRYLSGPCPTWPWNLSLASRARLRCEPLSAGERVVDVGSGAGFDSFVAADQVGPNGKVVGVDMTEEMLAKSRSTDRDIRAGMSSSVTASQKICLSRTNGRTSSSATAWSTFAPTSGPYFGNLRVLRPGGHLQFADIANGKPVPEAAIQNIDLWTA